MADIAASDVTYTQISSNFNASQRVENVVSVTFGDGALTYPAGGVPLVKGNLGFATEVEQLMLIDDASANGFVYKIDLSNLKIRIYQGDNDAVADGPLIELVGGAAAPAAATLKLRAVGY